MKHWKCNQCIHVSTFRKQIDISLQNEVICHREDKAEIIKDDDEECKWYCCEAH